MLWKRYEGAPAWLMAVPWFAYFIFRTWNMPDAGMDGSVTISDFWLSAWYAFTDPAIIAVTNGADTALGRFLEFGSWHPDGAAVGSLSVLFWLFVGAFFGALVDWVFETVADMVDWVRGE